MRTYKLTEKLIYLHNFFYKLKNKSIQTDLKTSFY